MKIELQGKSAVIGLAAGMLLVVLRLVTLGESEDPKLHEAIHAELVNRMGGRMMGDLEAVDTSNPGEVEMLLKRSSADGIQVHSACVSGPLLSMSSSEEVFVRVDFSLPEGQRQREYWRFQRSKIAGWRYERPVMALSYFLNFF